MILQEISFNHPVKIIQVFRNINIYGKEEKSFEKRKEVLKWTAFQSKSGLVSNDELYLPETILHYPDFTNSDLIVLADNHQPKDYHQNDKAEHNYCFTTTRRNTFHIFEIINKECLELHLKYDYFKVGIPERKNFKLCDIKLHKPVEIKINGKTDASLSSRRARVFMEQQYIINYLGDFRKCRLLKEPYTHTIKNIPIDRKVVDLLKPLW